MRDKKKKTEKQKTQKQTKLQDLKPSKDAKGGTTTKKPDRMPFPTPW